jgi:hypothetical protein
VKRKVVTWIRPGSGTLVWCTARSFQSHGSTTLSALLLPKPLSPNSMEIDLLQSSVADLQNLLASGDLKSTELVSKYLDQIEQHNTNGMALRAIISVSPKDLALKRAQELDDERQRSGPRGPMHGIPVIVKVDFPKLF